MTNEELLNAIRTGNNSLLMELWNQNSGMIRKHRQFTRAFYQTNGRQHRHEVRKNGMERADREGVRR